MALFRDRVHGYEARGHSRLVLWGLPLPYGPGSVPERVQAVHCGSARHQLAAV